MLKVTSTITNLVSIGHVLTNDDLTKHLCMSKVFDQSAEVCKIMRGGGEAVQMWNLDILEINCGQLQGGQAVRKEALKGGGVVI